MSLRQRITPDPLLGRVNSAYRLLAWGTMPLGAAAGGLAYAHARPIVPVMQLVLIVGALVTGLRVQRHAERAAA